MRGSLRNTSDPILVRKRMVHSIWVRLPCLGVNIVHFRFPDLAGPAAFLLVVVDVGCLAAGKPGHQYPS